MYLMSKRNRKCGKSLFTRDFLFPSLYLDMQTNHIASGTDNRKELVYL